MSDIITTTNPYEVDFDSVARQASGIPWTKFEKIGDGVKGAFVCARGPVRNPTFGHDEYVYTFRVKGGGLQNVSIKLYERAIIEAMSEVKPGQFCSITYVESVMTRAGKPYKKKLVKVADNLFDPEIASGQFQAPTAPASPDAPAVEDDPFAETMTYEQKKEVAMALGRAKYGAGASQEVIEKALGVQLTPALIDRAIEALHAP